jgi:hypothetical protein
MADQSLVLSWVATAYVAMVILVSAAQSRGRQLLVPERLDRTHHTKACYPHDHTGNLR